jgi:hypothetical protein
LGRGALGCILDQALLKISGRGELTISRLILGLPRSAVAQAIASPQSPPSEPVDTERFGQRENVGDQNIGAIVATSCYRSLSSNPRRSG